MNLQEHFLDYIRSHSSDLGPDNPDNYLGVWTDENQKFSIDVSTNMQDRAAALRQGVINKQSAVFDNAVGNPVDLPEPG